MSSSDSPLSLDPPRSAPRDIATKPLTRNRTTTVHRHKIERHESRPRIEMNRKAVRIIGAGSAAAVITLLCYMSGFSETSRANLANLASGSGSGSGSTKAYAPTLVVDTYDKTSPPGTGCEAVVSNLQTRIIEAYSPLFEGIRHINMFGYLGASEISPSLLPFRFSRRRRHYRRRADHGLETENKGDAAIWTAQQILFSLFGIETMQACR